MTLAESKIIKSDQLAEALDNPKSSDPRDRWTAQRASRWMQATKCAFKRGGRWITTPELLLEKWPEAYWEWVKHGAMADDDTDEGDDGCVSCVELRSKVGELEEQIVELADRLAKVGGGR